MAPSLPSSSPLRANATATALHHGLRHHLADLEPAGEGEIGRPPSDFASGRALLRIPVRSRPECLAHEALREAAGHAREEARVGAERKELHEREADPVAAAAQRGGGLDVGPLRHRNHERLEELGRVGDDGGDVGDHDGVVERQRERSVELERARPQDKVRVGPARALAALDAAAARLAASRRRLLLAGGAPIRAAAEGAEWHLDLRAIGKVEGQVRHERAGDDELVPHCDGPEDRDLLRDGRRLNSDCDGRARLHDDAVDLLVPGDRDRQVPLERVIEGAALRDQLDELLDEVRQDGRRLRLGLLYRGLDLGLLHLGAHARLEPHLLDLGAGTEGLLDHRNEAVGQRSRGGGDHRLHLEVILGNLDELRTHLFNLLRLDQAGHDAATGLISVGGGASRAMHEIGRKCQRLSPDVDMTAGVLLALPGDECL
mmetsp:Transcript_23888/g.71604  ORF Transcript_23888/g.71604 Transcript_23888/m.71604 type:complete len:431 (+) Transcript_23888:458-1750(+)